jgi:ribonuclease HII
MGPPPRRLVGVDEAGRGSFVGPLVVGAFAVASDRVAELRGAGARDSKELTATARARVFERIARVGEYAVVALDPRTVDRAVVRGKLNELEAQTFGRLIHELGADEAFVDACDVDEARFGRLVARSSATRARVTARHHADRDEPVVGAASIVAKVTRDAAIGALRDELGPTLGSGYPSDQRTVAFVRAHLAGGVETPDWLRVSWATMARVKVTRPARNLEEFAP